MLSEASKSCKVRNGGIASKHNLEVEWEFSRVWWVGPEKFDLQKRKKMNVW